jgi:glycosyltransferase 2 family protein
VSGGRQAARLILAAGIAAGIVWLLARSYGGTAPVLARMAQFELRWVGAAFGVSFLCVVLGVVRWQQMVAMFGHHLPFKRGLSATLAVWPLVLIAPSRSNELLRAWPVRDVVPGTVGAGSVITEKVFDLLLLLGVAAAGTAAQGLWGWSAAFTLGVLTLTGGLWGVSRAATRSRLGWTGRWRPKLELALTGLTALRLRWRRGLAVCGLSLLIRLLTIAILALLLRAAGAQIEAAAIWSLAPAALLAGLLPFTLTGIGVRDAAFVYLLVLSGQPPQDPAPVIAATLAYSVVSTWAFALLGAPLLFSEGLRVATAAAEDAG